jgi:hypothetical protein
MELSVEDPHSLLIALKSAHNEVLAAADAFERIVRGSHPGDVVLTNIRLKLTATNGRKTALLERIYTALGPLSPGDAERIRELRANSTATRTRASAHIARWTTREMMRDWEGYVADCRFVPPSIRASVSAERRYLYPLLDDGKSKAA